MRHDIPLDRFFQPSTDSGSDPVPLTIRVDKQPVKIACCIDISKADDPFPIDCDQSIVFFKGPTPFFQIDSPRCPRVQLLLRIVFCIDRMDRVIKKIGRLLTV